MLTVNDTAFREADMELTQTEAVELIQMEKKSVNDDRHLFPSSARKLIIPLESLDGKEDFSLDIHQCNIRLKKLTLQNRARTTIILLRLDLAGPPHMNPDGEMITGPHLHIYREGFGDRFAEPLPQLFDDPDNKFNTLVQFLRYCNITQPPKFDRGMLQ